MAYGSIGQSGEFLDEDEFGIAGIEVANDAARFRGPRPSVGLESSPRRRARRNDRYRNVVRPKRSKSPPVSRPVATEFLLAESVASLFLASRGLSRLGGGLSPWAKCPIAPRPTGDRRAHTSLPPKPSKGPQAFHDRSLIFATRRYCKVEPPRKVGRSMSEAPPSKKKEDETFNNLVSFRRPAAPTRRSPVSHF